MKRKIAIVDIRISDEKLFALRSRGFMTVAMPPCPTLSEPLASHPDMLIARVADELLTSAEYCELAGAEISEIFALTRKRFHFTADRHGSVYPHDVIFNSLLMGSKIFARLDSLSPYIKELATERGIELINVNQGYPACTTLKLSDEAAITADRGMAEALLCAGIRVYTIDPGGIELPPYEYGFIGGCAGVYDNTAYFLGDAATHPSWSVIKDALDKEGLRSVMLGGGALTDLGGIIFAEGDVG